MQFARKNKVTKNEKDGPPPIRDLNAIAVRARKAAASFGAQERINDALSDAAAEIGKAWSGGWVGYHSRVYKAGFAPVHPGEYWDTTWGGSIHLSETVGDWREFAFQDVVALIIDQAGTPDIARLDAITRKIGETFDRCRDEASAILAAIPDDFLSDIRVKIEATPRSYPAQQVISAIMPREYRCADRRATSQGLRVPPHVSVQADSAERASFVKGCRDLADHIERAITYLATKSKLDAKPGASSDAERAANARESMTNENPSTEALVRAALYASLLLNPRTPGLAEEELIQILGKFGKQRGDVRDAVKLASQHDECEWADGRLFVVDSSVSIHLDFILGFEDDPRDKAACAFVQRWVLELANAKTVRGATFGRADVLAAAAQQGYRTRDVDYALELLSRKKLVSRTQDRDTYQATDQIRTYGIMGEQPSATVRRWTAFSMVLSHVEQALLSRDPVVKQNALVAEIETLPLTRPSTSEAAEVLEMICRRFVDSAAPVLIDDVEASFSATFGARERAFGLAEAEYVTILDTATNPSVVPTIRGAALYPRLYAEALVVVDELLRRAGDLRRNKRASDAPLVGAAGLMDPRVGTPHAIAVAKHLVPSLRPIVAGNPPNPTVTINDIAREYDALPKLLDYKLKTFWRTPKKSETENTMTNVPPGKPDRVFIIHGRNGALLDELRQWFDSLGLHAKGFEDLRVELGGSPTIMQVIEKGMTEARAIVALITPDEVAYLRPEFHRDRDMPVDRERWQARPNVIFEAGMAFAMAGTKRTLLLVAGNAELFTDVSGIHYLSVPHDAASRDRLKTALRNMGCEIRDDSQHHNRGNFAVGGLDKMATRSPFEPT